MRLEQLDNFISWGNFKAQLAAQAQQAGGVVVAPAAAHGALVDLGCSAGAAISMLQSLSGRDISNVSNMQVDMEATCDVTPSAVQGKGQAVCGAKQLRKLECGQMLAQAGLNNIRDNSMPGSPAAMPLSPHTAQTARPLRQSSQYLRQKQQQQRRQQCRANAMLVSAGLIEHMASHLSCKQAGDTACA